MNISKVYLHGTNDRKFIVEDIRVHLNFDGIMETRAIIRFIGGFYDGKTSNIIITADFLSKLTEVTE